MNESGAEIGDLNISPEVSVWKMDEKTIVQGLKERFVKALGRTTESLAVPQVNLDIYYHAHAGEEDAKKLSEHFKSADIFIPEMLGWSEKRRDMINRVSQGEITPAEGFQEMGNNPREFPYEFQLEQMVYKSEKPVAYIDYSRDDPRLWKAIEATERMENISRYWEYGKSFPDILQEIKNRAENAASVNQEREEAMINNLKGTLTSLIETNPELRKKAKENGHLNILLSVGAIHTGISHLLSSGGNEVSSKFSTNPMIYGYMHEGTRRYRVGQEVDNDFAAKMLAESLIFAVFGKSMERRFPTVEEKYQYVRKIVDTLTYQSIENIVQRNPHGEFLPMERDLLQLISRNNPEQSELLKAA